VRTLSPETTAERREGDSEEGGHLAGHASASEQPDSAHSGPDQGRHGHLLLTTGGDQGISNL
jgi:hypothetical protein